MLGDGDDLPFLFLDATHFSRWRGHCLARLGEQGAIAHLTRAAEALDPSFVRAGAGLHCDLAAALAAAGELDAADAAVRRADALAKRTTSTRQQRRVRQAAAAIGNRRR